MNLPAKNHLNKLEVLISLIQNILKGFNNESD